MSTNTNISNGKKVSVNQQIEVEQQDEQVAKNIIESEVGEEFLQLWNGNLDPVDGDREAAEKSFIDVLLYFTKRDREQIERLASQSKLMSDTWDNDGGRFQTYVAQLAFKQEDFNRPEYPQGNPPKVKTADEHREDEYKGSDGNIVPPDCDVVIHNGKYQTVRWVGDDEKTYDEEANFVLEVNSFLRESDGTVQIDMDVIPASPREETYSVVVDSRVFNEPRDFKKEVCKGTTVTYKGTSRELADIKQRVGNQDAPSRDGVNTVGLHGDEMVTPEGVINDEWELDDPEHSFVPRQQAIEDKWNLEIDEGGDYDSEEVANIVETLWKTRDSERFLPVIGYWYASLLTPKIREQEEEIPLVHILGDTGVGKTATLKMLYKLIGMDGNPYSARDTKFALMSALSSTNNVPIWLDEYKPSDMKKYEIDTLQDFLRKATQVGDETRGNADQTVTRYKLEAPAVLSGEESIQGSAEQRRAIRTQFRKVSEEDEYQQQWAQLSGGSYQTDGGVNYCTGYDTNEHAKAVWQFALGVEDFESKWRDAKDTIFGILERNQIMGIENLELTALTMIQVGCNMYVEFGEAHGAEDLPTQSDIEDAILYIAFQMGQGNRTSHVGEFIALVADAIEADYLDPLDEYDNNSGDYTVVKKNKPDEKLRIKLEKAHHAVSKYVNDHNLNGVDLLDDYKDYRKRMKDDVEYIPSHSQGTPGLGRCVSIDTHLAEEVVDGFERGKIVPEVYYATDE
ncbi:DUF927 domain-containing protein [Halorubrum ezzemoulense]|nr:DUF927 domain-containing protein [Halorubrum ezzemoulense]